MPNISPSLGLPFLEPSQAQKHVTHNEALQRLDALVQLSVARFGAETPPSDPEEGAAFALDAAPTDGWAGHAMELAIWQNGAWTFLAPQDGWLAWGQEEQRIMVWSGSDWLLPQAAFEMDNLDRIGIGTTADAQNRLAVSSAASLFSHDGAGHQMKLNKAGSAETGTVTFQTNWSGRAEIGLAGNDDFSVKVSADGAQWTTALTIDPATGHVGINTAQPARPLHVDPVMRFQPTTVPANPATGDLYYDEERGRLRCFNGEVWRSLF
ncbi:DUF2793 domain-containing protein [Thalassococcus sp. S3]|uniref:DUF2793 domain-containing protein n=1 Tax=Thalassococcus sp. S3 TaxID=2017482 RepID=UPI00102410C8|nr:DUF2793 domain-containing protein [Thalassococcus sp. S3]QBF34278.1 hypothetical protein CFI11_24135 [Thalassococcus sp. S3]